MLVCGACAEVVDDGAAPPWVWEGSARESEESCLKIFLSLSMAVEFTVREMKIAVRVVLKSDNYVR